MVESFLFHDWINHFGTMLILYKPPPLSYKKVRIKPQTK